MVKTMRPICSILTLTALLGFPAIAAVAADSSDVRSHAEQSFEQLKQQADQKGAGKSSGSSRMVSEERGGPTRPSSIGSGRARAT